MALKWGAVIPTMGLVSLDGAKIHELDLVPHEEFVVVRIRLFASSSIDGKTAWPVYLVIAAEKNGADIRSA